MFLTIYMSLSITSADTADTSAAAFVTVAVSSYAITASKAAYLIASEWTLVVVQETSAIGSTFPRLAWQMAFQFRLEVDP